MLTLTQPEDEDEDNHLCIKCNNTIIGLDNYVQHRKERCGKNKYNIDSRTVVQPSLRGDGNIDLLDHQYSLGADVFFQSLELQSSSKRNPLVGTTQSISSGGKGGPGVITRRVAAISVPVATVAGTTNSGKASIDSPIDTRPRGEDWIGGHSLKVISTDDNQTKLIKAVANISGAVKKETSTATFDIVDDYKHDDDSNEDSDESDDLDDEDHHAAVVKWKPPSNHTGGKWQPGGTLHHWPSRRIVTPEPDHAEDWDIQEEHTGGKWKPIMTHLDKLEKIPEIDEDEDDAYMPPPGHTKGKWIPGAKEGSKNYHKTQIMDTSVQSKGAVQYWCGPCNRRLGSKVIYEKHLLSNLHLKRTILENELEFSGHLTNLHANMAKREPRPSQYNDDSIYTQMNRVKRKIKVPFEKSVSEEKKKRKRRPIFIHCLGCRSRVRPHLMGKHLISHYHFRKANNHDEPYINLVLENIEAIVHQSPFQCSPCKFYTNLQSNFIEHWYSKSHVRFADAMDGKYWCAFCKFECTTSLEMIHHMNASEHQEVVAAINRSMPILIRKKSVLRCDTCKEEFRYNVQLKYHAYRTGHPVSHTASLKYQDFAKCNICGMTFKSSLTLASHLKIYHRQKKYVCLVCSLTFDTAKLAQEHRRTQQHKITQKEKRRERGLSDEDVTKKCQHCNYPRLKNIIELKKHIQQKHPDIRHKCPMCAMEFVLPQEVSVHIRKKSCHFQNPQPDYRLTSSTGSWKCSRCPFQTDSKAECYFHEVMHGPSQISGDVKKYKCPLCHCLFRKASLRCHLRRHTTERPYACSQCDATFTRRSSLANHFKSFHEVCESIEPATSDRSAVELMPASFDKTIAGTEKKFLCSICGASFTKRASLHRHSSCHSATGSSARFPCSRPGCGYASARSSSELRAHEATHEDTRAHPCLLCSYAAKTKQQLARHSKVHSGVRERSASDRSPCTSSSAALRRDDLDPAPPSYACPHCRYTCKSLENLRKHILKTNKHPGLPMYTCRECVGVTEVTEVSEDMGVTCITLTSGVTAFTTNLASELRKHLMTSHAAAGYNYRTATEQVAGYCKSIQATLQHTADSLYLN